jgi:hypothetical protein
MNNKKVRSKDTLHWGDLKYRGDIADEYGYSAKTLSRKLASKAIKLPAGLISIDNQILIYKQLGVPPHLSQYIQ